MTTTTLQRLTLAIALLSLSPVCATSSPFVPYPQAPDGMFPTAATIMRQYAPPNPQAGLATNLYSYNNGNPVNFIDPMGTAGFKPCVGMCARTDLIQNTAPIAVGLFFIGWPSIPYPRSGLAGSSGYTSPASLLLSSMFPQTTEQKYCAPTWKHPNSTSNVVGRILGRFTPILGGGILIFDGGFMAGCTGMCMGLLEDWQVSQ